MANYQIQFKRVYDAPATSDGIRVLADELAANPAVLSQLVAYARQSTLTLLSAVKNFEHSHLPVLKQVILTSLEHEDQEINNNEPSSPVCFGNDFNHWGRQ